MRCSVAARALFRKTEASMISSNPSAANQIYSLGLHCSHYLGRAGTMNQPNVGYRIIVVDATTTTTRKNRIATRPSRHELDLPLTTSTTHPIDSPYLRRLILPAHPL